jgi:hypothetical protein
MAEIERNVPQDLKKATILTHPAPGNYFTIPP